MQDYTGMCYAREAREQIGHDLMLRELQSEQPSFCHQLRRKPMYRITLTVNAPLTPSGVSQCELTIAKGIIDADVVAATGFAAKAPEIDMLERVLRSGTCVVTDATFERRNRPKEVQP